MELDDPYVMLTRSDGSCVEREFCLESEGKILRYLSINPTGASGLGFLWDYLGVREGTGGRATIGVIETRESCK